MTTTKQHMKDYVDDNPHLISVKKQAPNTTVLKYKNKVFYKNLWTPEICELRGTVVDDNFDIVQRPFTKIFNPGESHAPVIDAGERVEIVQKINGFMGAATLRDGKLFVSTTGSIASDFADLVRDHLAGQIEDYMLPDLTYIFEICDESDPHIIEETAGVYLLGTREKSWNAPTTYHSEKELDKIAELMGVMRPYHKRVIRYDKVLDDLKTCTHEGYVVRSMERDAEIKLKSPYYLATKFLARKSVPKFIELLEDTTKLKQVIDEEFYGIVDYLSRNRLKYVTMDEQQRVQLIRTFFDRMLGQ